MKAKRVTGMLLVSALAVSLFTGCGGGSSENEGGTAYNFVGIGKFRVKVVPFPSSLPTSMVP